MSARYSLSEERKLQFACIYVLEYMINKPEQFALLLPEEDADLEPILTELMVKNYVRIKDDKAYVPTAEGRTALEKFLARYSDYLNVFDVYCAIDLGAGEFAFASYFEIEEEANWNAFLEEERWEDLRIAVAEFKKMDPVEIVFMSFIAEGRFGKDATGWQFDLLLGTVWDEILEICETAIHCDELGYTTDDGAEVSSEAVMEDIIRQGAELIVDLHKREAELAEPIDHGGDGRRRRDDDGDDDEVIEEVVIEHQPVDYYYGYHRDPYYVGPSWGVYWW